jgi:hypothetical protein
MSACRSIIPVPVNEQTVNVKLAVDPVMVACEFAGLRPLIDTVTLDGELEYLLKLTVTVGSEAPAGFKAYTWTVVVPHVAPLAALRCKVI